MSVNSEFNSRVYPIKRTIQSEIDDIQSLRGVRYGNTHQIGTRKWRIEVLSECSERTDNQKYLSVYLLCLSEIKQGKTVHVTRSFRLINLNDHKSHSAVSSGASQFTKEDKSWGYPLFLKWNEIEKYSKDGKILVECTVELQSEDGIPRRTLDFEEERPNTQDKMIILKNESDDNCSNHGEKMEFTVNINQVTNDDQFTDSFTINGLPCKLSYLKYDDRGVTYMEVFLYINSDDKSDWWMCEANADFRIASSTGIQYSRSIGVSWFNKSSPSWGSPEFIEWNKLIDPANGYVKNGKFVLEAYVRIYRILGIDERTGKGIDRPMRKMTDVVLVIEGKQLHVSKKILAQQSAHFAQTFRSGNGGNITNVKLEDFVRFLELVYNYDTDISEENIERVLKLIEHFKAPECFERCDVILKKMEFKDTMKMLHLVDTYPLPELKKVFLHKLKDEALLQSVIATPKYKQLSQGMKVAILEWKLVPEEYCTEKEEITEYRFSTDFEKKTDLTDVEIEVETFQYYVSKQILANASEYFMKRFYGPYSEDVQKIELFNVEPLQFEKLLTHIYHPTRPVTVFSVDSLLVLAHQFKVPKLLDKCEEYLVLKDGMDLMDKLEYAGKYNLPLLLATSLKAVRSTGSFKQIFSHPTFSQLPSHVLGEIMKLGL
ncbi:unnamed protein product [Caenorhabditis sp. 36 PRJEB53466]|nr:unnamed protein product [Caenorhabditis sp. 36 PRJEB53466]